MVSFSIRRIQQEVVGSTGLITELVRTAAIGPLCGTSQPPLGSYPSLLVMLTLTTAPAPSNPAGTVFPFASIVYLLVLLSSLRVSL